MMQEHEIVSNQSPGSQPVGGVGAAAGGRFRRLALAAFHSIVVATGAAIMPDGSQALAQEAAQAAQRPPLSIPVFISSRSDLCYDPGDIAAIKTLATQEQDRINRQGGVAGRLLQIKFLDDQRNEQLTIANLRAALADPQAIAMIGLSHSDRAKAAFDALGKDIRDRAIPLLSNISVNSIFRDYPSVFTTQASQDDERLPAMTQFIRRMNFERPAFVGMSDALFSRNLGDGMKKLLGESAVVADHRLHPAGDGLAPDDVAATVASLKEKQPDILVLGIGAARAGLLMKAITAAGITPALFVAGRIDALPPEVANAYPNAIYQLAWDRLPEAFNDRLRRQVARDAPEKWTFEGQKVNAAPGWSNGQCKPREENGSPDPLEKDNLRAIGIGTQYADMVALIAAAMKTAEPKADIDSLRRLITRQLTTSFAAGKGAFKGTFDNWSFKPGSRSAVRTPFIVILPHGLGRTQLAPLQFIRVRDGSLKPIDTLYADVNLIRAHRIDDNEKTFFAEFYLTMRNAHDASIDMIEFTNAFLDPKTNGRQITVETLHNGGKSDAYPEAMKVYKVAGRFVFEPELGGYPFDTQRFSIDLQPKRGDRPFIVQPPPFEVRDKQVATDGWDPRTQYVGYDEDFVPVVDAYTHEPSVTPFYKASFVWLMKRQTTDYFLRVVVPLGFILIVAYLSIFIPQSHFEAIVTIQVTALLSAVALYLSLPKLDSDTATVSDRIFVFVYMLVSFMIAVSIMRVNRLAAGRKWLTGALATMHVALIPIMVAVMAWYINSLTLAER
jgi:ABC-type branched-subunit amino acid transport system substrate-binding protein